MSRSSARDLRGVGRFGSRGGVRSDDEMLSSSSSSAVARALGKRSHRWITGSVEGAASVSTVDYEPLESVAELLRARVGYTTADLVAEIMREMDEIEGIASISRNLKGTCVRRLKLASRRARRLVLSCSSARSPPPPSLRRSLPPPHPRRRGWRGRRAE
jgi:hypothetical protein